MLWPRIEVGGGAYAHSRIQRLRSLAAAAIMAQPLLVQLYSVVKGLYELGIDSKQAVNVEDVMDTSALGE